MTEYLTPHFTRAELNYDSAPTATVRANLQRLAELLEDVRETLGVPLRVTSGYRSPATNAATAGASATSQHLDGSAADVVPVGMALDVALRRLVASPVRARWGQLIAYPVTGGHLHVALPNRNTAGQMLVQVSTDSTAPRYVPYTTTAVAASAPDARGLDLTRGAMLAVALAAGVALLDT